MASHFKAIYRKLFYFTHTHSTKIIIRYCILIFFSLRFLLRFLALSIRFFRCCCSLFLVTERKTENEKSSCDIEFIYTKVSHSFFCIFFACACVYVVPCVLKEAVISMLSVCIPAVELEEQRRVRDKMMKPISWLTNFLYNIFRWL